MITPTTQTRFSHPFEVPFSYPVSFTRDLFASDNSLLADTLSSFGDGPHKVIAFVDSGLEEACPDLPRQIESYAQAHSDLIQLVKPPHTVPGGEQIKNDYRLLMHILDTLLEFRLCRHSFVLILGGGAVLDAVGFATSITHRGLRIIRMPSTVLAQNDAGIGVKTGMNLHGGKNTIGTFHPPVAVLNDLDLLNTLPDDQWRGGLAEAFKVAILKDPQFVEQLCTDAEALRNRDADAMERQVMRTAELHMQHIATNGDPFELGQARPLDFGHWAAHKLESMSNYHIGHGQAVAIGLALDSTYAMKCGLITPEFLDQICLGLRTCGLPVWHELLDRRLGDDRREILLGLEDFREHLGGQLCITLPCGPGEAMEVNHVDADLLEEAFQHLKARTHASHTAQ